MAPVSSQAEALPAPGSVVPGVLSFTHDGKVLTYLKSESASLSRVLWRVDLPGGTAAVSWASEGERLWLTGPATTVFTGSIDI